MEGKSLEELKEKYSEIQKKFELPSFEELNREFSIEKAAEIQTDFLIREVRRFIADKFSNYMRFLEAIIHPVNAPLFIFSIIKAIREEEKKKLTEIYKKMIKNEVELIERDVDFSEEKDAVYIKTSHELWKEIKKELLEIVSKIKANWDNKFEINGQGYFG